MMRRNTPILQPVLSKPVLLQKIKQVKIQKEYVIDNLAKIHGHVVLKLPPYHCVFSAIEMVWSELKHNAQCQNVFTDQPEKVISLICRVCEDITPLNWENYVKYVQKEEENYIITDHIVHTKIDPLIIEFNDSSDVKFLDDCGVSN